jgi:hypothetical protein
MLMNSGAVVAGMCLIGNCELKNISTHLRTNLEHSQTFVLVTYNERMFWHLLFTHRHLRAFREIGLWWNLINPTDAPVSPENLQGTEIQALSIFLWIRRLFNFFWSVGNDAKPGKYKYD